MSESLAVRGEAQPAPLRTLRMNSALTALAVAGVVTALLFGGVTAAHATPAARATPAAHATPMNRVQALRAARQYLQTMPFSLKGLVQQLKYEGYSTSDATYGATYSGANWMKQAVRAARQYLQTMPFSFRGMVQQLQYEG